MERVLREVMTEAEMARIDGERVAAQEREDGAWDALVRDVTPPWHDLEVDFLTPGDAEDRDRFHQCVATEDEAIADALYRHPTAFRIRDRDGRILWLAKGQDA